MTQKYVKKSPTNWIWKKSHINPTPIYVSDESDFFNFEEWKALDTLSEDIGCMLFLQDLVKYKVIKNSSQFKKAGKHVSIFCPVDAVYKKVKAKNKNKVIEQFWR